MNQTLGTSYRTTTKATKKLITARLRENFTVEDFKTVIWKKGKQWKDNPMMVAYLRPTTLFASKFEDYLNEKEVYIPEAPEDMKGGIWI